MEQSPVATMTELHDEHAAALWGYCLRLTGHDHARAEDVAQETFLRAWRSLSKLDESAGSVRARAQACHTGARMEAARTRV